MDFDNQARSWLLGVQRKLYQWSKGTPEGAYGDVWNWITIRAIFAVLGIRLPTTRADGRRVSTG